MEHGDLDRTGEHVGPVWLARLDERITQLEVLLKSLDIKLDTKFVTRIEVEAEFRAIRAEMKPIKWVFSVVGGTIIVAVITTMVALLKKGP